MELEVDEVLSDRDPDSVCEVLSGCNDDCSDGSSSDREDDGSDEGSDEWLSDCEDDDTDDEVLPGCEVGDPALVAALDTMVKRPLKV